VALDVAQVELDFFWVSAFFQGDLILLPGF
jgi:hypothetical protein